MDQASRPNTEAGERAIIDTGTANEAKRVRTSDYETATEYANATKAEERRKERRMRQQGKASGVVAAIPKADAKKQVRKQRLVSFQVRNA